MILQAGQKPVIIRGDPRRRDGFTLIELMLVMAMLLIVMGISFPTLKGFFHGRNMDSEARRFLSVTRFAQSRAISEGTPIEVWIDIDKGKFGLRAAAGFVESDRRAFELEVAKELKLEVTSPINRARPSLAKQLTSMTRATMAAKVGQPIIRFLPDGTIGEGSPERVLFREKDGDVVGVVESADQSKYEVQDLSKSRR